MSNPCKNDPRPAYFADYTHTMQTDTLLKIRDDLAKNPQVNNSWTWEAKRFARITNVLEKRGVKITTRTMKPDQPKPKKPRNVKHVPASYLVKPDPITRISKDELEQAKREAAKFLPKPCQS